MVGRIEIVPMVVLTKPAVEDFQVIIRRDFRSVEDNEIHVWHGRIYLDLYYSPLGTNLNHTRVNIRILWLDVPGEDVFLLYLVNNVNVDVAHEIGRNRSGPHLHAQYLLTVVNINS